MKLLPLLALAAILPAAAVAEPPVITGAAATEGNSGWDFGVTIRHPDTGWDHYADGWDILDAEGNVLATRVLHHPHVNEQPFTRGLTGVALPEGTQDIFVRAKCSAGDVSKPAVRIDLPW